MMNPWPVVAGDLRRSRWGAIAVVLLVALAVALGVAVSAQERALRQGSARAAEGFDLVIGARGGETQLVLSSVYLQIAAVDLLPAEILADLLQDPLVRLASPIGYGDSYRDHLIAGVTPAFVAHLAKGHLAEGSIFARLDEVVVGADVALPLGERFSPLHGHRPSAQAIEHSEFQYRVVGHLPKLGNPWDRAIVSSIEAVWWIHSLPVGHRLDERHLYPSTAGGAPDLAAVPIGPPFDRAELTGVPAIVAVPVSIAAAYQLRQKYRNHPETMAVFPAEVLVQLYRLLGDVRDVVALLSIVTQVLVIGAVLLAVGASLAQRRRLIGTLRALGASRRFVFAAIWLNVALLLAAGAISGLGLGWAAAWALSVVVEARTSLALPVVVARSEFLLVAAVIVIGTGLAALPAWLSYRNSVATALKAGTT